MVEPSGQPPASPHPLLSQRLLWYVLLVCWIAIALWVWHQVRNAEPPGPDLTLRPLGSYHTVTEVSGLLLVRLDDGTEVRVGGAAEPQGEAARKRLADRLTELAPAGTLVYVEREPQGAAETDRPAVASIFLPAGKDRTLPFPYDDSRLLGAVLVQEGAAPADADAPYRYREEFLNLEDDARRHRRGIWAAD